MEIKTKTIGPILLIIGAILLSGCLGGGDTTSTTKTTKTTSPAGNAGQTSTTASAAPSTTTPSGGLEGLYAGFMEVKPGQWVDYVITGEEGEAHQKMKNIGEDTINGVKSTGFEMEMEAEGFETIIQSWVDSSTQEPVKYAMKTGGLVMCMDIDDVEDIESNTPPMGGEEGTPEEYMPDMPDITYGTYTTPTGKKVDVAKFITEYGEFWVSSEVPFGMVKTIQDGETIMYLYDYGTSGATRALSKTEIENCMDLSGMMGDMPDLPT